MLLEGTWGFTALFGPDRSAWAWCAPNALSGRRSPLRGGGGGGSLPCGYEAVVPCYSDVVCLCLSCHTAVSTKRRWWWLQDHGGAWSWAAKLGGDAPLHQVFCGPGWREILVCSSDPEAVSPSSAPFLLEGRRGKPMSTLLWVSRETLGPVWSGQQCRVNGASLLEGVAWFSALWGSWSMVGQVRGCIGCVSSSLHWFIVAFISFLLGMCLLLPRQFCWFELLYLWCGCYINIARQKIVLKFFSNSKRVKYMGHKKGIEMPINLYCGLVLVKTNERSTHSMPRWLVSNHHKNLVWPPCFG
jgi:hypothetical protein